jgi:hypothetical protein
VLLVAWIIISQYVVVLVDVAVVLRPLVIGVIGAVIVTGLAWTILRNRHAAGLVGSAIVIGLATKPVLAMAIRFAENAAAATAILIAASAAALFLAVRMVCLRQPTGPSVTRFFNAVALIGLALVVGQGSVGFLSSQHDRDDRAPALADPAGAPPDIYVLIPDAYPGSLTLERVFAYDNEPFLEQLEARRFVVDRESHANYWFTSLTLASMLDMQHVGDIDGYARIIDGESPYHPGWRIELANNRTFSLLREHGYKVIATDSGWEELALRSADSFLDAGHLNDLEVALIRGSFVGDVVDVIVPNFIADSHRSLVTDAFESVRAIARSDESSPRFVLAHLPVPHRPFSFRADGSAVAWADTDRLHGRSPHAMGVSPAVYTALQLEQVRYVNDQLLMTVDTIMAESHGEAVVIVVSDHGPGNHLPGSTGLADLAARYRNLFAAYTPGERPFPSGTSPVSVMSRLLNAYLGTHIPIAPPATYAVGMVVSTTGALRGISDVATVPHDEWMTVERERSRSSPILGGE